ncbi:hypothetical protein KC19_VG336500 [Ceratodon purpureus]|uniref:Uncharacterized protein n=1 Tax=Ceratodon purpureus TaxID=3225 RepID=A0A8T0HXB9_CERPU|nr:hypothetical protein KC19_VG336500 [Ceratodon purpureus]
MAIPCPCPYPPSYPCLSPTPSPLRYLFGLNFRLLFNLFFSFQMESQENTATESEGKIPEETEVGSIAPNMSVNSPISESRMLVSRLPLWFCN